ncbi:MAG: hypothetical protein AAB875_05210, partial [Patescibacteria group bacterium]
LRRVAEGFGQIAQSNEARAREMSPPQQDIVGGGVSSGVQSFTQNAMLLPLAFLPGGQFAALAGMTAQTGGAAYQQAREKGIGQAESLTFAASQAAIEYATEKLPLARLLGDVRAGSPIMETLARQAALEIPGEQVATVLQDMNEWAILHPEKPFTDYLAERPGAAAQTLIATLVGVGGNVALTSGIDKAMGGAERTGAEGQQAEQHAAGLTEMAKLAEASKLRERDPAAFGEFMQAVADENIPEVFVDAKALLAAGNFDEIAAALPSVAAQIQQAAATGGDVIIPTGELMQAGPGSTFLQGLLEHARTSPEAMSVTEAREYMQQFGDQVKADIEQALAQREGDQSWQQMRDEVQAEFKAQLDSAKRFTSDVNQNYANLLANFYSVTAAKLGITSAPGQGSEFSVTFPASRVRIPAPEARDSSDSRGSRAA